MKLGQLTSVTSCKTCHMPLEIYANQSEVICKYCGSKNNLVINKEEKQDVELIDQINRVGNIRKTLDFIRKGTWLD